MKPGFIRRLSCWTALFLLLSAVTGCSSFNREWKRTVAQPSPPAGIAGAWEGYWRSDVNGHHGRLRCVMSEREDGNYLARIHAVYWKIFRYSSRAVFEVEERPGKVVFIGDADLGWLAGGRYHYEGEVQRDRFFSTYRSKYDHGIFEMHRPGHGTPQP